MHEDSIGMMRLLGSLTAIIILIAAAVVFVQTRRQPDVPRTARVVSLFLIVMAGGILWRLWITPTPAPLPPRPISKEEAEARFPAEWHTWLADPWDARPPEGETYREVEARVIPFVRRLVREHAGQAVLILAHGGVNRVIVCRALGLPMQRVFGIEQDYACVNGIECSAGGRWHVTLMNSALPGDPLLMPAAETTGQAGKTG